MRIVRRRVMRSAGANTIGKRINLAAAMLGACSPDECSADARMQSVLLMCAVRLREHRLPVLVVQVAPVPQLFGFLAAC